MIENLCCKFLNIDYVNDIRKKNLEIERFFKDRLDIYDVTYLEYLILENTEDNDNATNISKKILISQSNTSAMIKKMIEKKLLTKTRSTKDERVVYIKKTKRAEELINRIKRELKNE